MKLKITLAILWLGILLAGSISAQDEDQAIELAINQDMLGAYPQPPTISDQTEQQFAMVYSDGPTSAVQSQQQLAMAFPSGPISTPGTPISMPGISTSGIAAAYPGTSAGGAPTAIYTTAAPPSTQQNVLLTYNTQSSPPAAVYYSGGYVPWTTFSTMYPTNPMLWVATTSGWAWYATCPIGGWLQNMMYIPYPGALKLYELYPDGSVRFYNFGWSSPGYKYIWFYADTPGRHITLFTLTDKPSNYITVDVY